MKSVALILTLCLHGVSLAKTFQFLNKSDVDKYLKAHKGAKHKVVRRQKSVTPWRITVSLSYSKDARVIYNKCKKMGLVCHRSKRQGKIKLVTSQVDSKLGTEFYNFANRKYPGSTSLKKLRSIKSTVYLVKRTKAKSASSGKKNSAKSKTSSIIIIGKDSSESVNNSSELEAEEEEEEKKISASASIDFGSTQNGIGFSAIKAKFSRASEIGKNIDYKLGVKIDHIEESIPLSDTAVFFDETYLKLRRSTSNFTLGYQKINWGRVAVNSSIDRSARLNYRRAIVDEPEDQNLPAFALRGELFLGNWKLDSFYKPFFQAPLIPDGNSVWSLYQQKNGTLLGERENPGLSALIFYGSFEREFVGSGGFGARIEHFGSSIDIGVALQNVPWNEPYYQVNPKAVTLLEEDVPVQAIPKQLKGDTFLLDFPQTTLVSMDIGANIVGVGARLEVGFADAVPVRQTDFRAATSSALLASGSAEFFPFSGSGKMNVAISTRRLNPKVEVSDERSVTQLLVGFEDTYKNDFWKLRINLGKNLDTNDLFFNSQLRYLGFDVTKAFLQYRHFTGPKGSIGGHYQKNSGIAFGLQFLY